MLTKGNLPIRGHFSKFSTVLFPLPILYHVKQVNTQESLESQLHYGVFKRVGTLIDVHKFLACDVNAFLICPRWRRKSVLFEVEDVRSVTITANLC